MSRLLECATTAAPLPLLVLPPEREDSEPLETPMAFSTPNRLLSFAEVERSWISPPDFFAMWSFHSAPSSNGSMRASSTPTSWKAVLPLSFRGGDKEVETALVGFEGMTAVKSRSGGDDWSINKTFIQGEGSAMRVPPPISSAPFPNALLALAS